MSDRSYSFTADSIDPGLTALGVGDWGDRQVLNCIN